MLASEQLPASVTSISSSSGTASHAMDIDHGRSPARFPMSCGYHCVCRLRLHYSSHVPDPSSFVPPCHAQDVVSLDPKTSAKLLAGSAKGPQGGYKLLSCFHVYMGTSSLTTLSSRHCCSNHSSRKMPYTHLSVNLPLWQTCWRSIPSRTKPVRSYRFCAL